MHIVKELSYDPALLFTKINIFSKLVNRNLKICFNIVLIDLYKYGILSIANKGV